MIDKSNRLKKFNPCLLYFELNSVRFCIKKRKYKESQFFIPVPSLLSYPSLLPFISFPLLSLVSFSSSFQSIRQSLLYLFLLLYLSFLSFYVLYSVPVLFLFYCHRLPIFFNTLTLPPLVSYYSLS